MKICKTCDYWERYDYEKGHCLVQQEYNPPVKTLSHEKCGCGKWQSIKEKSDFEH